MIVQTAFVGLLMFALPVLGDDSCRPRLFTAGQVKAQVENSGRVNIGSMTLDQKSKRCKRKITVIMPKLHAKSVDVANINARTDVDVDIRIIGNQSIKADTVAIGNVKSSENVKINRKFKLGKTQGKSIVIGNTEVLSKGANVKIKNEIIFDHVSSRSIKYGGK